MDDTIDSHYVNVLSVQTAQSVQAVYLLISGLCVAESGSSGHGAPQAAARGVRLSVPVPGPIEVGLTTLWP
jgi:hypothetical protein